MGVGAGRTQVSRVGHVTGLVSVGRHRECAPCTAPSLTKPNYNQQTRRARPRFHLVLYLSFKGFPSACVPAAPLWHRWTRATQ